MRFISRVVTPLFALALIFVASPAHAGDNIPWTWNSGDHDAKGKFVAKGEHFKLCRHNNAKVYIEFKVQGQGKDRHFYDGPQDSCADFNDKFKDGKWVKMQVCEQKTLAPDDCSRWRRGEA